MFGGGGGGGVQDLYRGLSQEAWLLFIFLSHAAPCWLFAWLALALLFSPPLRCQLLREGGTPLVLSVWKDAKLYR